MVRSFNAAIMNYFIRCSICLTHVLGLFLLSFCLSFRFTLLTTFTDFEHYTGKHDERNIDWNHAYAVDD
jgi:hypothetical protein